ncbi:MAG: hypothetical protein KF864_10280 [Phycisphaeraceae bacterium]|nr:hypothetical protein [Phycisphaeraceae bacterium]
MVFKKQFKRSRLVAGWALAAFTGAALAAGPDVIVGALPDISHWTSNGAINGKRAYSVGTTSCNIGDVELLWIANTNQHPVISNNMYRLANGRFEQLGQSWLKHGFTALQGTVCDDCSGRWPNGTRLGVGCSDPYSSGLNGSQSGLGPKSEVNASTGYFPYPWGNNGIGSGDLFKRLVVNQSDLETPGALYFVASMYVAPDDAAAGNALNNASYRRVTVNQSTFGLSLTGPTERTKPAIFAWKDHGLGVNTPDPAVFLTPVDVPQDGRFWVGAKATDLGNGLWSYEYAVQNLNSHQSGQSFTIPLPAGAQVSNIGFTDVDYHSGEPFSGVDWSASVSANGITWSTQTHAQNVNANALRFDTLYNFRFVCDVPPAGGSASLGLFRPPQAGGVSSINFNTVAPSADGQQRPLNDVCATAVDVGAGVTTFSTAGALTDGFEEPGACATANYPQIGADVWFRYTPTCAGNQVISLCGSAFDTKLAVYAACPTGPGQAIVCNDDFSCPGGALQSQVTFTGVAGTAYLIRVGGYQEATGNVTMTITAPNCGPQPPANDACANAFWAADGIEYTGSTTLATNDGTSSCGASTNSPDVWFKYRPTVSGPVGIDTCGSTYDTVLAVFNGCGGTQLACNDDSNSNANAPCRNLQSYVSVNMTAGQTYLIRVTGYNGATGAYKLHVIGGGGVVPPANDNCAERPGIALGATPFSTIGATTDGPTHNACNLNGSNQITNDLWFNYPSQCDGILRISTCDSNFNTKIAVYGGYGCENFESRLLACSDDDCGNRAEVSLPVASGDFITIRLGGFNGAVGTGTLFLECVPAWCPADYNSDGGVDGADVEAFFLDWEAGDSAADINEDGGVDGADVESFFLLWEAGGC